MVGFICAMAIFMSHPPEKRFKDTGGEDFINSYFYYLMPALPQPPDPLSIKWEGVRRHSV